MVGSAKTLVFAFLVKTPRFEVFFQDKNEHLITDYNEQQLYQLV